MVSAQKLATVFAFGALVGVLHGCGSDSEYNSTTTSVPDNFTTTIVPDDSTTATVPDDTTTTTVPHNSTTTTVPAVSPTTTVPAVSTTEIVPDNSTTTKAPAPTATPSETNVLVSQEKGLCLEPAGALEGVCSFHDTGLDFKQSLRFAECLEGSLDQQWIVDKQVHKWGTTVTIRPAKKQEYCITMPEPYYGSVIDPENHGDFEVWLCQCGQKIPKTDTTTVLDWDGAVLGYGGDYDSYLIGYDKGKMRQCYGHGYPNPKSPKCEGTHWSNTSSDNAGKNVMGPLVV